tara:strand:- start:13623 stop:15119 length:1497 start_codon:yes stop_codon:yes gene_type:complete
MVCWSFFNDTKKIKMKLIFFKFIIFFMLLIFTNNCSSPKEYNNNLLEGEVPNTWTKPLPKTEEYTGLWWISFGDEEMVEYLENFQKNSPNIKSILSQLESAKQLARINSAVSFPNIQAGMSGSRSGQNLAGFGFSDLFSGAFGDQDSSNNNQVISFESDNYGLNLSLQWELDIWGKALNARRAAYADFNSSNYDLVYLSFSTMIQFVQTYYYTVESKLQYELSLKTTESFREVLNIVESRYKEGLTSSLDYRLAESSLAVSKVDMESKKIQFLSRLRNLEILLGFYPSGKLKLSDELPKKLPPIPSSLPADLLTRRPDLKSALEKVKSAGYKLAEAKRSKLPSFSLTTSGGTSSEELKNVLNGDYGVWSRILNISAPIFQGGRLDANVKLNKSQLTQSEINLVNKSLMAFMEVEQLLNSENSIELQLKSLNIAVSQSKAAYDLSKARYESGLIDFVTVLNSQNQWFNSQSQYFSIERTKIDNRLQLILALGGSLESLN